MLKLSSPSIGDEECQAVERVLRSGQLVHGEECELFETELSAYLGCSDVIVVSSGTAALHLALISLGIGPGDAVLVPDFTFPATVNVVELVGARPVLVDVGLHTYNITPENIEKAIALWRGPEKLRAVMPVHEFGCPADMSAIMEIARKYDLYVVEDAACGLGATHNGNRVGTFGQVGCFSFHPRKAITTGEGGAIATNDPILAKKIRAWRNHGIERDEKGMNFILPGFNYRLTNFQAALGRVQLRKFDAWIKIRYALQCLYRKNLQGSDFLLPEDASGHAWQTFMVVLPEKVARVDVIAKLREKGVETNLGAQGIHCLYYYQHKYMQMCSQQKNNVAEILFQRGLALPLFQAMQESDVRIATQALKEVVTC